jgi:hypothetical protein
VGSEEVVEAPATEPSPPSGTGAGAARSSHWRTLRLVGFLVFAIWLVGLAVLSSLVYHRDFLAEDFATYNQAWTLIGHGNLYPFDTVYGFPFVRGDLELVIWPLALIHLVFPQPVALLWIQDLAVAGCGLVAYAWILDYLEQRQVGRSVAVGVSSVVLLLTIVNPGVYLTLGFDVHMEPLAAFFLLLAGRDLWRGRPRRAWCWVAVVLLCGAFAAVMVVGLGVSALLAGRATRRAGLLLVGAGVVWILLVSALQANEGASLASYAYLGGQTVPVAGGVIVIVKGIVAHPGRAWDNVYSRHRYLSDLIRPVGVVGLASAWGFGVPAAVMLIDALNSRSEFISASFQNFAVFPFVLLGTVMVLVGVAERFRGGWIPAVLVAVLVTLVAVSYGYETSPATVRATIAGVAPGEAAALRTALARTPSDAEVIATIGIMGRFCGRQYCYYFASGLGRPVHSNTVVFVFAAGKTLSTPGGIGRAIAYVEDDLHAQVLVDSDGVTACLWRPPPHTTQVTVPTGAPPSGALDIPRHGRSASQRSALPGQARGS